MAAKTKLIKTDYRHVKAATHYRVWRLVKSAVETAYRVSNESSVKDIFLETAWLCILHIVVHLTGLPSSRPCAATVISLFAMLGRINSRSDVDGLSREVIGYVVMRGTNCTARVSAAPRPPDFSPTYIARINCSLNYARSLYTRVPF